MSKTRHVKRTQMVASARFRIRGFVMFSVSQDSNATKPLREMMFVQASKQLGTPGEAKRYLREDEIF